MLLVDWPGRRIDARLGLDTPLGLLIAALPPTAFVIIGPEGEGSRPTGDEARGGRFLDGRRAGVPEAIVFDVTGFLVAADIFASPTILEFLDVCNTISNCLSDSDAIKYIFRTWRPSALGSSAQPSAFPRT
jgi:hypothetical protein